MKYFYSTLFTEKKALIEKRKMPSIRSKEITYRLCKALKECLSCTPNLACLELQGLPLRERDLQTLIKVRETNLLSKGPTDPHKGKTVKPT